MSTTTNNATKSLQKDKKTTKSSKNLSNLDFDEIEDIEDTPLDIEESSESQKFNSSESNSEELEYDSDSKKTINPVNTRTEEITYEKTTITITISLLPADNDPQGRGVILSASNTGDLPVSKWLREKDILPLPEAIASLIEELKADLPNRETRRKLISIKQQNAATPPTSNKASSQSALPEKQETSKQLTLW